MVVFDTISMMEKIKHIYCDFDGTITKHDAVNMFFEQFAHKDWLIYEEQWIKGEISSRENAIKQVALVRAVSSSELNDYIESIEIDEYFLDFIEFITKNNINFTILSDGFDLFISEVLNRYKLAHIKYYANHLVYKDNKFSIEFPYYNNECIKKSGMCKCKQVQEQEFCYIGDGTSDLCVAQHAKILFATKSLCKHCVTNDIKHIQFENFSDIIKNVSKINGV